MNKEQNAVVLALRDAAPYLLSHHGRTMVILLPSSLLNSPELPRFLEDVTLIGKISGIKFALTFDVRLLAAKLAKEKGVKLNKKHAIVTDEMLELLRQATTHAQEKIEFALACDVAGIEAIGTTTPSLFDAHEASVVDGEDPGAKGTLKPIAQQKAKKIMAGGAVVLLRPLGKNNNQTFYIDSSEMAVEFAKACEADKLIVVTSPEDFAKFDFVSISVSKARAQLRKNDFDDDIEDLINVGFKAIDAGVTRIHYINSSVDGALLIELLTTAGVAAMITKDQFEGLRWAKKADASAIYDLISPAVGKGAVLPRSVEQIRKTSKEFVVVARDNVIIACANLQYHGGNKAVFGCLAVRNDYVNQTYGGLLLDYCEEEARKKGVTKLFAVTTQALGWFRKKGFEVTGEPLPSGFEQENKVAGRAIALVKTLN